MKKLLLIFTLIVTSVSFSQKEFQESFSRMYDVETEAWFDCNVTVIYNLNENGMLYKIYVGEDGRLLKRTSNFLDDKSDGEYAFTAFTVEDMETGEEMVIQKFHKKGIGIRVLFKSGKMVQFTNKL